MKKFGVRGGGSKRIPMPPPPGVEAKRVDDDTVLVSYELGTFDPRCRPVLLELTLDDNSDGESGANTYARIREPQGEVSVSVPVDLRDADVFTSKVRTSDGLPSDASTVLIDQ